MVCVFGLRRMLDCSSDVLLLHCYMQTTICEATVCFDEMKTDALLDCWVAKACVGRFQQAVLWKLC